jgi:hypothetical protein
MKNEIILRFCIWDFDDISCDEMTQLIGIKPSKIYIKGQKKNAIGSALAERNGWLLDSPLNKYSPFEDQMNSLLDIIESKIDIFRVLDKKYYCEFSCALYIYFDNEESIPWLHLDARYNQLIKELNIEFDVDIYCLPNDKT